MCDAAAPGGAPPAVVPRGEGPARAVGGACHANPIAILLPCHRVVGSTGSLTGFAGGLPVKEQLLALEAAHSAP